MKTIYGKQEARFCALVAGVLVVLGIILYFLYPKWGFLGAQRASFGMFYVLFLPGYAAQKLFFQKKELDWVETAGISFGLSMAFVIIAVLFVNLVLKIKLSFATVFLSLFMVIVSLYVLAHYKNQIKTVFSRK